MTLKWVPHSDPLWKRDYMDSQRRDRPGFTPEFPIKASWPPKAKISKNTDCHLQQFFIYRFPQKISTKNYFSHTLVNSEKSFFGSAANRTLVRNFASNSIPADRTDMIVHLGQVIQVVQDLLIEPGMNFFNSIGKLK